MSKYTIFILLAIIALFSYETMCNKLKTRTRQYKAADCGGDVLTACKNTCKAQPNKVFKKCTHTLDYQQRLVIECKCGQS